MNNLTKMNEILKDNPELQQKITAEAKKLVENKEAENLKEAFAKAINAVLDIELTQEELDALFETPEKMNLDDLDAVAGGFSADDIVYPVTDFMKDNSWFQSFRIWYDELKNQ